MSIPRGVEHEYAVTGRSEDGQPLEPRVAVQRALDGVARTDLATLADWHVADEVGNLGYERSQLAVWDPTLLRRPAFRNGMRVYDDTGHFEVSSPSWNTSWDAIRYDRVGDLVAFMGAMEASRRHGGRYHAYKTNTSVRPAEGGYEAVAFGTHYNLCLPRNVAGRASRDVVLEQMMAFFACRPILLGGGGMLPVRATDDPRVLWSNGRLWGRALRFVLSPRGGFVRIEASLDTTVDRGMANLRDESHADDTQYMRYHDINLDGLRSPYQVVLRDAIQYGVFSAMLEGRLDDAPTLEHAPQALKDVSFGTPDTQLTLSDGRTCHALRDLLCDYYLVRARESLVASGDVLGTLLIDEALWIAERLMAHDYESLRGLVDWPTKLLMIENSGASEIEALNICNQYALLDSDGVQYNQARPQSEPWAGANDSLYDPMAGWAAFSARLGRAYPGDPSLDWFNAISTGPAGTRDSVRTVLMQQLGEELQAVSWGKVYTRSGEVIDLPDPRETRLPAFRLPSR